MSASASNAAMIPLSYCHSAARFRGRARTHLEHLCVPVCGFVRGRPRDSRCSGTSHRDMLYLNDPSTISREFHLHRLSEALPASIASVEGRWGVIHVFPCVPFAALRRTRVACRSPRSCLVRSDVFHAPSRPPSCDSARGLAFLNVKRYQAYGGAPRHSPPAVEHAVARPHECEFIWRGY